MRHQILTCQRCFRTNQKWQTGLVPAACCGTAQKEKRTQTENACQALAEASLRTPIFAFAKHCRDSKPSAGRCLRSARLRPPRSLVPQAGTARGAIHSTHLRMRDRYYLESRVATFFGAADAERSRSARYCSESLSASVRISIADSPVVERVSNTATMPSAPSSNISTR